jgi:hypothetical protein
MTDAAALPDRTTQMLDLLAEMDLAAAQHVHAQLLATTEPAEVATLARAYQRASRGLRQVLMLKMKHEKDRAEAAERAAVPSVFADSARSTWPISAPDSCRTPSAAWPQPPGRTNPACKREALDRLDVLIADWLADDNEEKLFLDRLDDWSSTPAKRLDLPLALARQWEDLPEPIQTFDPAVIPWPPQRSRTPTPADRAKRP